MSEQDPLDQDLLAKKIKRQAEQVKQLSERIKQQRQTIESQNLKHFNLRSGAAQGRSEQARYYRNWILKLIPQNSGWTVAYCAPGGEIFIDQKTYGTSEVALAAARELVDRSIAGFTLLDFLFELYDDRKISTEQYSRLTSSLIQDCL